MIDLEATWKSFLERDLSIETALAIEFAHLNNTKFNTLQLAARSATKGDRRPADQLAKFAGRVGSALVLSTMLGRLYELAGFDEEALEFHLSALEFTPRWDAHLCSTVLNNIAWTSVLLGELEVAERWALRALEFDPCNPYATGTLCEALAHREPVRAEGLYRWLQARKFSAAAWGTYTPNPKLAQVQDYRPSLPVHKATNEDLLRLMVANHHDTNRPEPVKLGTPARSPRASAVPGSERNPIGEEACDGSDLCVDSAQVQAWGEGERIEVQTWPSLPFALTDTAADKVLCLVKYTGKAKATLPLAFGEALTLLDPAPGAPAAYVGIDSPVKVGDWQQFGYQVYGTSKRSPFPRDLAQTKALFLNHLASLGKVEAVQWALDGEPSAKPKKAKKTGKA